MSMIDIKNAFKTIQEIVPVVGAILSGIVIISLVLGVLLDVATNGSIGVIAGIQTFLNGTMVTDTVSALTNLNTVTITVVSLVIVVILIILFKMGGNKSDSKGSSF